ncbi:hypothetical protein PAXRUDRAFT_342849 [Paxillus rubicundulus Ve08.2h10]|uniref:Uncharacterized protein n=1 Tax=Paxillus rubicundulus Ve08.2h10 TaxID=930991 RepID=A0A0D0E9R5_9AGAM|nr:hypothetical protein PAXRUDRAFT_342849 [Paxillus rubicundulus Ve08.2h10]
MRSNGINQKRTGQYWTSCEGFRYSLIPSVTQCLRSGTGVSPTCVLNSPGTDMTTPQSLWSPWKPNDCGT